MRMRQSERRKRPPNNFLRAVQRRWERRRRWGEWGFRLPLLASVIIWAVMVGLVVTGAYLVIYHGVLMPKVEPVADSTVLSMALTIAAGTGGLVLLVVNYRKQHDLEESRFMERFGAAAAQLGHEDVAVRLAGVYALVGVAERTRYRGQIQQCIDVLCGYLRLPYEPNVVDEHQTGEVIIRPGEDAENVRREKHYKFRQNDEVVRQAILAVINAHLQRGSRYKWSSFDFDFSGVHFENVYFGDAVFSGHQVSFERARFGGDRSWFEGARFSGEMTSFYGAGFSGQVARFEGAIFSGERTWFDEVTFGSEMTWFKQATFSGKKTSFDEATFGGKLAWFKGVTFSGEEINFCGPRRWGSAPQFDWDDASSGIVKPENVKPDEWPPQVKPVQNP